MKPSALAALILIGTAGQAPAALSVSASVDRTTAGLGESLRLSVLVSGDSASLPEPVLPPLPQFETRSGGRSQSFSFVNGAVSASVEHHYVLVPRFLGKAVIGPIAVSAQGAEARTEPIEISVLREPGAAAPSAPAPPPASRSQRPPEGEALFATAQLSRNEAYVHQEVLYTLRFYSAVPLVGNAEWTPPATPGFLSEELPAGEPRTVSQRGRRYQLLEIRLALYPAQPGTLTVGPSSIRCQVPQDIDPFSSDFFQRFFSASGAALKELRVPSLPLKVKPLPEGKPEGYAGAVGRYRVRAQADKKECRVGDAVTWSVSVEGEGSLKSLAAPPLPEMPSWRVYETLTSLDAQKGAEGVRGAKTFKTVLVPKASGELAIPSLPFSYFDPERGEYVRLATQALAVRVLPGAPSQAPSYAAPDAPSVQTLSSDIRHIQRSLSAGPPRPRTPLWHALPAVLFAGSFLLASWRARRDRDPDRLRFKRAAELARGKLRRAATCPRSEGAALLGEALVGFAADKLGSSPGLSRRQAREGLARRFPRLEREALAELERLWEELDVLRFAPLQEGALGPLAERIENWIKTVEGASR